MLAPALLCSFLRPRSHGDSMGTVSRMVLLLLWSASALAGEYPLWDGKEPVADYAKRVGLPATKTVDLGNGVRAEMVLIPAGRFVMGTPEPVEPDWNALDGRIRVGQALLGVGALALCGMLAFVAIGMLRGKRGRQVSLRGFVSVILSLAVCCWGGVRWHQGVASKAAAAARYEAETARFKNALDYEKPAHVVTLARPFYLSKYEVTQEQYAQVMGANPSAFKGRSRPAGGFSWNDAVSFCKKVGGGARLPSEAEWEYACRAGTATAYYGGDDEEDLARVGWYRKNSSGKSHPVGGKDANAFGLYDMHGNVWEWVEDDWHDDYVGAPSDGSAWVDDARAAFRVLRGGCWYDFARGVRSANRSYDEPGSRGDYFGFRFARGQ